MNDTSACRCENFEHPRIIFNPPGRDELLYRVGDYVTFRHALLLSLKGKSSWSTGVRAPRATSPCK